MSPEQIEGFAIRAALGNNGGTWATHYTEGQKEHWRQWVRDLAEAIKQAEKAKDPARETIEGEAT
jgi:heme oxygenase